MHTKMEKLLLSMPGPGSMARIRRAFYDSSRKKKSFPLFDLPKELRFMVYEEIVANDPPTIDSDSNIRHPLLHADIRDRVLDEAASILFHTVPLVVDPHFKACYNLSGRGYGNFLRLHDQRCGRSQRHRIRLHVPLEQQYTRCSHLRCILRPFRCSPRLLTQRSTLAYWNWYLVSTGIRRQNVSIYTPKLETGPFVDDWKLQLLVYDVLSAPFALAVIICRWIKRHAMWLYDQYVQRFGD